MTSSSPDGGSAFPNDGGWGNSSAESGMSLRDYFAAKAMQAIIAKLPLFNAEKQHVAESAYYYADAMIRQRSAKP